MLYVEEGWREVGGETLVASGPAAVSGGHGQFHIFVRDHDGHLRHTPLRPGTSEAHWDPLSILARSCRSDPAAVYSSGSRIEVFVQDDHDNLRRITYDPLRSLRPVDRGPIHAEGTMPMGPSVASNSQGYFDILIRGANDRSVWSLWVDDGGTGSGWMPWGGSSVASAPTLALDPAGFFDVFYHDDSGYLSAVGYQRGVFGRPRPVIRLLDAAAPRNPGDLPPYPMRTKSGLHAASVDPARFPTHVFIQDGNDHLSYLSYGVGVDHPSWTTEPTGLITSKPCAVSWGDGSHRIEVFARTAENSLRRITFREEGFGIPT